MFTVIIHSFCVCFCRALIGLQSIVNPWVSQVLDSLRLALVQDQQQVLRFAKCRMLWDWSAQICNQILSKNIRHSPLNMPPHHRIHHKYIHHLGECYNMTHQLSLSCRGSWYLFRMGEAVPVFFDIMLMIQVLPRISIEENEGFSLDLIPQCERTSCTAMLDLCCKFMLVQYCSGIPFAILLLFSCSLASMQCEHIRVFTYKIELWFLNKLLFCFSSLYFFDWWKL
jgi:hypothetical protein